MPKGNCFKMNDNFNEKNLETLKQPINIDNKTYRPTQKSSHIDIEYSKESMKKSADVLIDAD